MKRRIIIALLAGFALSLMLLGTALAHAKLVSSDPAAGARLTAAPAKITLVFDEEISDKATDSFFTVKSASGAEVGRGTLDNTDLDHKTLSGTLTGAQGDGVYTVSWKTLTADDNGVSEGSFTFGINADAGAQPTAAPEEEATAAPTTAAAAAAPTATAQATTTAAQPTATAGAAPSNLPNTGGDSSALLLGLGIALLVIAGGVALRGARHRG